MNKTRISIIMPCYNMAQYVERAIKSVLAQTADKTCFELIIIDDSSTDASLEIIRNYKENYPDTIQMIRNQVNIRQGASRNEGIKLAKGEYIVFLDADDWLEPYTVEMYCELIKEQKPDIIYSGSKLNRKYEIEDITADPFEYECTENSEKIISTDYGCFWTGIYRRRMILDNNVYFPEKIFYEDIYWGRLIKIYAHKVCRTEAITYHYYYNPESTVNRKNSGHHLDRLESYEMLLEKYKEEGILKKYYFNIMRETIEVYVINTYFMIFTRMDDIPEVYERIRSKLFYYFPDWTEKYDKGSLPMVYEYLLKYIEKADKADMKDLQIFKESILEVSDVKI